MKPENRWNILRGRSYFRCTKAVVWRIKPLWWVTLDFQFCRLSWRSSEQLPSVSKMLLWQQCAWNCGKSNMLIWYAANVCIPSYLDCVSNLNVTSPAKEYFMLSLILYFVWLQNIHYVASKYRVTLATMSCPLMDLGKFTLQQPQPSWDTSHSPHPLLTLKVQ